jgi:hypothetical protein
MDNDESKEPQVGRPTKYNETTIERLCEALADGLPVKSACTIAGIGVSTLAEWREQHTGLEERMGEARERYREKALQTIKRAIDAHDWRAAVAALKLVFPEYRESTKIDVNAIACASGGVVITEAERLKLLERHERAMLANSGQ